MDLLDHLDIFNVYLKPMLPSHHVPLSSDMSIPVNMKILMSRASILGDLAMLHTHLVTKSIVRIPIKLSESTHNVFLDNLQIQLNPILDADNDASENGIVQRAL